MSGCGKARQAGASLAGEAPVLWLGRREPALSAVPVLEYSQTGVNTAALPDAAVGEQRQRVARRQAGGVVADVG